MAKQDKTAGVMVHYMQASGAHSVAIVTAVRDDDNNIVDLFIMRNDNKVRENFDAENVPYSEELEPETWHFIEGHKLWKKA